MVTMEPWPGALLGKEGSGEIVQFNYRLHIGNIDLVYSYIKNNFDVLNVPPSIFATNHEPISPPPHVKSLWTTL